MNVHLKGICRAPLHWFIILKLGIPTTLDRIKQWTLILELQGLEECGTNY